jgi:PAS domain S-box-containing protein
VQLINTERKRNRNLLTLPAQTLLTDLKMKDIPLDIEYIYAKLGEKEGKLFDVKTVLRIMIAKDLGLLTIKDTKGDLPFEYLNEESSLMELQILNVDHVVVLSSNGNPKYVIDSATERKKLAIYEAIIENFQEEIFLTDKKGKTLFVNPKGAQIIGLSAQELIGEMIGELVRKEIISSSGALTVLKQKKKVDILQYLKKSKKWRLCTGIPILNKKGKIIFTLCTSKDMTELVEIKKELENKENELKRKDNELSNMQNELFAQVNFISKSAPMHEIKETINKIAPLDLTVIVQGETGVGKEVAARAIHTLSPRRNAVFIKISCASFPETLISSELFGYESGAFTGADAKGRKGKIELAHKGTLFLDEIGEIPHDLQVKLLEFLQDMELYRIGGTKKIKIDTRIIAATNRDLQEEVNQGRFRKDLYYRLNLIPIIIPPLRERKEDIPALIRYYLDLYNRKHNKNVSFDDQVINEFVKYHWPGNVRELKHVLERAVVIHGDGIGSRESYEKLLIGSQPKREGVFCSEIIPYKQAKRELERELVEKAYKLYRSTYKAADALGIAQSTVVRILKRLARTEK